MYSSFVRYELAALYGIDRRHTQAIIFPAVHRVKRKQKRAKIVLLPWHSFWSLISLGIEAFHLGQVELMGMNDPDRFQFLSITH